MVVQMNSVGTGDMVAFAGALGYEISARNLGVLGVRALCG